ncbi:hypothetical protein [Bizionia sp.]|uniref:hypothetical protein n=1 Tax=Bizionia sp. TaxID=1954480 RepID=UPI003A8FEC8C
MVKENNNYKFNKMYKYIYYKLYKIAKKSEATWAPNMQMPEIVAFMTISILGIFNLITIFIVLVHGLKVFKIESLSIVHGIITMAIIYLLNYLFFLKNRKYYKIEKYFDAKSANYKNIMTVFFILYIILSIVVLIKVFTFYSMK